MDMILIVAGGLIGGFLGLRVLAWITGSWVGPLQDEEPAPGCYRRKEE